MNTLRTFSLTTLFACTTLALLPALVSAQATASADKGAAASNPRMRLRIAVDQLKWEEIRNDVFRNPADVREGIQSLLIEKLVRSGVFEVMEREFTAFQAADAERQIDNQNRSQSSTGGTGRTTRQNRVAARYIITPTVIGFSIQKSGNSVRVFGQRIGDQKETATLKLNIRISDAETSTTLDTQTAEGKQTAKSRNIDWSVIGINGKNTEFTESAAGKAVEEALEKAVKFITDRLANAKWKATVAKQDEVTKRVIINAGGNSGVQEGMTLRVYRKSADIEDPDTGKVIPGDEVAVGTICIERVENDYAYARVVTGNSFHKGDVARFEQAGR